MSNRRRGVTFLELIMATTLMTALVATVTVVLRTGHVAWEAQQGDAAKIMAANATLRHIVRRVRQAQAVTAISPPNKKEGNLSLLMPSGETLAWTLDKQAEEAFFGVDSQGPVHVLIVAASGRLDWWPCCYAPRGAPIASPALPAVVVENPWVRGVPSQQRQPPWPFSVPVYATVCVLA